MPGSRPAGPSQAPPRPGEPNIPVSTQPPVRKARRFRAQGGGQGRVHTAGRAMALPHPVVPGGVSCPPLGDEAACPAPSQYEEKDKAFKEQLSQLATLLPTLQVRGAGGARLGTLTQRAPVPSGALSSGPPTGSPRHLLLLPQLGQQGRVSRSGLCESPSSRGAFPPTHPRRPLGTAQTATWWPNQGPWAYLLPLLHTVI